MEKLKVLVVDDTLTYRKILTEAVEHTGLATVKQTATNGSIALERLAQDRYDIVLLDVFMPELDGLETLAAIRKRQTPPVVIMISSFGAESTANTIRALEMGAMDFILKPTGSTMEKNIEVLTRQLQSLFVQIKINLQHFQRPVSAGAPMPADSRTLAAASAPAGKVFASAAPQQAVAPALPAGLERKPKLIVVASSTGGPLALETVFARLPADFNVPILVVQHMPPQFTQSLAKAIDAKCPLKVREAAEGDSIDGGTILIAPGGAHMLVTDSRMPYITLAYSAPVNGVCPAADVLFGEVARLYAGSSVLAVVLTGMGSDGMQGVRQLKKNCNCYCITQSAKSCVVYGMPRSVDEMGLSDEKVDLEQIGPRLVELAMMRR